jgi:hypothetical protein
MQLTSRYLFDNTTTLVANDAGFLVEYRPVYRKQLNLYRGIDNVLQFKILNADQKPVNISSYTAKFQAFDENRSLIIEHDGVTVDATKGLVKVTVTENDLLNVKDQFLSYNIHLVDASGNASLTYSDTHFGMNGTIKLNSSAFPGPLESISITTFSQDNLVWYSNTITAQPGINGNEALHTAVIYSDGYSSDVVVQATLDNQVTGTTDWADIATVSFTGNETEPTPVNFNGVFNHLRFKATSSPSGTISKILVRN